MINKEFLRLFMLVIWLITILLFLVDIPLTIIGTNKLGIDYEGNPNVKEMLQDRNYNDWIAVKIVLLIPALILLYFAYRLNDIIVSLYCIIIGSFMYFYHGIVIFNWLLVLEVF